MKYAICVVRDRAADVYGVPFFTVSNGMAVRSFTDMINKDDPSSAMNNHPEDFDLFEVGSYDDASAEFTLLPKVRQLVLGRDVKRKG